MDTNLQRIKIGNTVLIDTTQLKWFKSDGCRKQSTDLVWSEEEYVCCFSLRRQDPQKPEIGLTEI